MKHKKSTCTNVTKLTCGLYWVGKRGGEHSGNVWHIMLSLTELKKMKEIIECKEKSRIQS